MSIIEKLKDKNYVKAFGLMSWEEQAAYKKVGKENCLIYCGGREWRPSTLNLLFDEMRTYAIKPDYQPEPEDLECKHSRTIKKDLGIVFWYRDSKKQGVMNSIMLKACLDCKKVWVYDYAE